MARRDVAAGTARRVAGGRHRRRAAAGARSGEGRAARVGVSVHPEDAPARSRSCCSRPAKLDRRRRLPTGLPHVDVVTVSGPFNATGPGDTPSRRADLRLPSAPAAPGSGVREADPLDARAPRLSAAGHRRRPPVAARVLSRAAARKAATSTPASSWRSSGCWPSPKFLFRVERDPAGAAPGAVYRITDLELASRLSFFLWSSIPDDELLTLAVDGKLQRPARARAAGAADAGRPARGRWSSNFAGQWLLAAQPQDRRRRTRTEFPDFDDNLRQAFRRETELFFESIMREDRSVLDLLTADYTFVNERLAQALRDPERLRQPLPAGDAARRRAQGPARQGQHPDGHVARRSHVAGAARQVDSREHPRHAAAAAAGRRAALAENSGASSRATVRERLEQHRANPACASCHKADGSAGLRARELRRGRRLADARRRQPDRCRRGSSSTARRSTARSALRQALLARPEMFVSTLTEKLLTYALGRGLVHTDMPAVRAIVRDAARENYRFSSIVLGIVESAPFQMRSEAGCGGRSHRRAAQSEDSDNRRCSASRSGRNVHHEDVAAAADVPARHRRHRGAAAARCDGAGASRRGQDGGSAGAPVRRVSTCRTA